MIFKKLFERMAVNALADELRTLPYVGAVARVYLADGTLSQMLGIIVMMSPSRRDDMLAGAEKLYTKPLRPILPVSWRDRLDALAAHL